MNRLLRRLTTTAAATAAVITLGACGGADSPDDATPTSGSSGDALTIYSGRNENLVGPLLDQLEAVVGVPVEVRYAGSSELAAQILEEGDSTRADLFFSQDAGALGALVKADRLAELPADLLGLVPAEFHDAGGHWVATSGRARVLAYDPEAAPEVADMTGIDEILDERYRGRIGYAPTNASFHSFVTALRVTRGEEAARRWLEDFAALEPQAFESNNTVLDAVNDGRVSIGLINHYYWYQRIAENGAENVPSQIRFLDSDDPGALINVAGVGVLAASDQQDAAVRAVEFLLSAEAQEYFADETAEMPVIDGVTSKHDLPDLLGLHRSSVDLNDLDTLDETLAMLAEVGLT